MDNFGQYLRRLRNEQRFSLRELEAKSGVSCSYLVQIETGKKPPPQAEILKKLAPALNVPVKDLLKAAGYFDETVTTGLSEAQEVDMAFKYVMNDPRYQSGTRLEGDLTTEVKRFVVEMYEKATGKRLLP